MAQQVSAADHGVDPIGVLFIGPPGGGVLGGQKSRASPAFGVEGKAGDLQMAGETLGLGAKIKA